MIELKEDYFNSMSSKHFSQKERMDLSANRFSTINDNQINGNYRKQRNISSSSSSSRSDSNSDSDDTSSSGELIILENYTTFKSELKNSNSNLTPNSLKSLSTNNNHQIPTSQSHFRNNTSLPIIFERSDESSVSSQSTGDLSLDDDSTLSDNSSSPSSLIANEVPAIIYKEKEIINQFKPAGETTNNSCDIGVLQIEQPMKTEINSSVDINDNISPTLLTNGLDLDLQMSDSSSVNCNRTKQTMCSTIHTPTANSITDLHLTQQLISVSDNAAINKINKSSLSKSDLLLFNKRTPRFPVQNQYNLVGNTDQYISTTNSDNFECDNSMENSHPQKKPPISKKPTKVKENFELVTDLDDLFELNQDCSETSSNLGRNGPNDDDLSKPGSYFKNQMFKNYSKTDLKIPNKVMGNNNNNNRFYEKRQNQVKIESNTNKEEIGLLSYNKSSPSKRSQELVGNVVKMDKTINRVTNDIVRIDNAIDRLSQFNKNMMSNLEMMSDAELSSDFETHSIGAQTDPLSFHPYDKQVDRNNVTEKLYINSEASKNNKIKGNQEYWNSSESSNDSSTEKESSSSSDESIALKPSPLHQKVDKPTLDLGINKPNPRPIVTKRILPNKNTENLKLYGQPDSSDLSSLPESSVCDEPEKRDLVNKVKYFQRQIKKSAGLYKHPPNIEPPRKLVVEEPNLKIKSPQHPTPKPRNSVDNLLTRHMSNSSSESSNYDYNSRTLSNSNNHTHSQSPANSDSGSIISLNGNHFERRFQKGGGASARYNTKTKHTDKWGTGSKMSHRAKMEDESGSLSGKTSANKSPVKTFMAQSRSYNSLNIFNSPNDDEKLRSGSLATLNKYYSNQDISSLVHLIQHNLNLNHHDRIRGIFSALIMDNDHDKVEEIIDHFEGDDRAILMEIVDQAGYGLKDAESIFDMTMSRTDLRNHLRPGLSMSSISDIYYQQNIDNDKMVYWRADIEELLPPPMKPPPKPMPTNLLKSAIFSPESLIYVDNKVLEIMELEPTTFTELVSFLTRDCSKDVEKVRALFRWITMYDIKSTNFDPAAPNDTLIGILRAIKSGQMSNNELFFRMCRFAGIHCQFISGYSKGAGYRPGMAIKDNRMFRNVWTAVFVAGAWRFVNCNWGARYLTTRHQELPFTGTLLSHTSLSHNCEIRHRCDEFYFLTDAKQHIFEHFPDKKRWQLLTRPITLDQFMALPIVKSPFFNANLSFKRNYAEVLYTKKGKVTVKINMPQAVGVSVRLENRTDGSILRGLTLVRILDNQMIVVTAAPSQPGKFYLSIYINDDWKSEENMEMACSFQIHCSEHNYDRLVTGRFPDVGMLGATPAALNMGIIANPGVDPFVLWEERSTMKLNIAIRPGLRVGQRMMSYDRSGQNSAPCDSYAMLQYQSQGRSQYHLRFPIDGFYCLTIYAGVDDDHVPDTEPMECIYRLLVDCKRAQERIPPFPRQTSRWVGFRLIEPQCQHLELNTVYRFRILAAQCSAMSVVINETKWIDLAIATDNIWKGKINTGQELENLSVYGKFGSNEDDEFIKLLDYILVAKMNK